MGAAKIAYLSRWFYLKKCGGIAQVLKNINRVLYACDISYKADIAGLLNLPHQGLGVVIGDGCVIGKNVTIRQNVTIGGKTVDGSYRYPILGNDVMVGAGAVIIGKVFIGDNCNIGANSVVLKDVPANMIVVGIPGRII